MKPLPLLALLFLPAALQAAPRLGYVTIGPMAHFNFGNNGYLSFSWGVEAAYWTYENSLQEGFFRNTPPEDGTPGFSAALGFEVDRNAVRYYLEPQMGWVFTGISLGPVLEVPRDGGPVLLGLQADGWLNALVGFNLRYRRIGGRNFQALGWYAKIGALVSGKDASSD